MSNANNRNAIEECWRVSNLMSSMLFQTLKVSSSIAFQFFVSKTILWKHRNSFYFFIGNNHGIARDSEVNYSLPKRNKKVFEKHSSVVYVLISENVFVNTAKAAMAAKSIRLV